MKKKFTGIFFFFFLFLVNLSPPPPPEKKIAFGLSNAYQKRKIYADSEKILLFVMNPFKSTKKIAENSFWSTKKNNLSRVLSSLLLFPSPSSYFISFFFQPLHNKNKMPKGIIIIHGEMKRKEFNF